MQLIMSYFNHIAIRDNKPDSPQMKKESTKDPHELGSSRMGKRNEHVIVHQTQIRQTNYLKKKNTRKYMKPSTEISLHRNNTLNNPNKNKPITKIKTPTQILMKRSSK